MRKYTLVNASMLVRLPTGFWKNSSCNVADCSHTAVRQASIRDSTIHNRRTSSGTSCAITIPDLWGSESSQAGRTGRRLKSPDSLSPANPRPGGLWCSSNARCRSAGVELGRRSHSPPTASHHATSRAEARGDGGNERPLPGRDTTSTNSNSTYYYDYVT